MTLTNGASWAPGFTGTALNLDGRDDYAYRSDADLVGPFPAKSTDAAQSFTITAWIRLDRINRQQSIVTKQGFRARGFTFGLTSDNYLYLEVFSGNFTSSVIKGSTPLQAGVWYHTAVTYEYLGNDSARVRLYLNGTENGGSDSAVGPLRTNGQNFEVGRYGWLGYYLDGLIDEVRIYDRVLSPNEIAELTE